MPEEHFRHLRAQYRAEDPARARELPRYHLSQAEMAGLILTETRHPPRFGIPSHAHDLHSFYLVLEGGLTEFSDTTPRELDPRHIVFTPAGHFHRNTFRDSGGRCFLVELGTSWTGHLGIAGVPREEPLVGSDAELTRLGLRLYREFRDPDRVSPLSMEGLVLEILAGFARHLEQLPEGDLPGWLRQARDLLHDRFSERLTLAQIAEQVGVHPVHLARAFRRRYRHTPGEYQRRLRVEHASGQLARTRRALADIALSAGFADQAHFSRVFKDHTGLTPAQFRTRFAIR